jgi:hypothetical protein
LKNNLQAGKLQVFAQVLTGFYNSLIIEKKDAYTLVNTDHNATAKYENKWRHPVLSIFH